MVYLPLIHQTMRYLTGRETATQTRHTVGQALRVPVVGTGAGQAQQVQLSVTGEAARQVAVGADGQVVFRETQSPGIYAFASDAGVCGQFALNLDTTESDLTHATPAMIERLGASGEAGAKAAAKAAQKAGLQRGGEDPRGLWRTLFALALALMVFELALANSIPK
jgi:hypothetical protein